MKKILSFSNVLGRSEQRRLAGGAAFKFFICSNRFCEVCARSLLACKAACPTGTCSNTPVCPTCPVPL